MYPKVAQEGFKRAFFYELGQLLQLKSKGIQELVNRLALLEVSRDWWLKREWRLIQQVLGSYEIIVGEIIDVFPNDEVAQLVSSLESSFFSFWD